MRIGQGLPGFGRSRLNKLVRVSVGTLNVGSMTGRGRELAEKGRSVQESRWKGNKASELGGYCQVVMGVQMREGEMEWGWHYPKNP